MIFIIMPTYNKKELTDSIREQLAEQTYQDYSLIIVENGTVKHIPDNKTIIHYSNKWWSGSINLVYDYLNDVYRFFKGGRNYVLIINNDIKFKNDFLEKSIENLGEHYIKTSTPIVYLDWKKLKFSEYDIADVSMACTSGLIMTLDRFLLLGKFSRFIPHYLSDYDYTLNATKYCYLIRGEPIKTAKHSRDYPTFSKKYPGNPIYYSVFIIKNCPLKYMIQNIIRVWAYAFYRILK